MTELGLKIMALLRLNEPLVPRARRCGSQSLNKPYNRVPAAKFFHSHLYDDTVDHRSNVRNDRYFAPDAPLKQGQERHGRLVDAPRPLSALPRTGTA
jgi:hypothetical protein